VILSEPTGKKPTVIEGPFVALSSTALLCFHQPLQLLSMGAFSPLLPEIGRANGLADWQLRRRGGALASPAWPAAIPSGWLAGATSATDAVRLAGADVAGTVSGDLRGRFPCWCSGVDPGFAYTLGTWRLIALLQDDGAGGLGPLNSSSSPRESGVSRPSASSGCFPPGAGASRC